jgi:lipid A oxidase
MISSAQIRLLLACPSVVFACGIMNAAAAEFEFGFYAGAQSASSSSVKGNDPGGVGDFDFNVDWEGKSGNMPPYYGFRGTWWRSDNLGFGFEFTHSKVYADSQSMQDNGFSWLEFSDGLNIVTVNVHRRWRLENRRFVPYVSGGLGVAIPHVEAETLGGRTFDYQLTGPAAQWTAGVLFPLGEKWSIFGEYKGNYSQNKAKLDNGGSLETNILTNAINLGVSFTFGR